MIFCTHVAINVDIHFLQTILIFLRFLMIKYCKQYQIQNVYSDV